MKKYDVPEIWREWRKKMRNTFKKIMTAVLAVALLLGVLAVPPQDAQAAGKSLSLIHI